jgi:putative methyltransferase (TIGR04325 family)
MLRELNHLKWNVVEQAHFVREGITSFSNEELSFYYDIESCIQNHKVNVILLSSVLQYIEHPYELLDYILSKRIDFLIIDRAPLLLKGKDRITIQTVPKKIYKATYPCWLLNEKNFLEPILDNYDLIFDEELKESINIINATYKFYFFRLKNQ